MIYIYKQVKKMNILTTLNVSGYLKVKNIFCKNINGTTLPSGVTMSGNIYQSNLNCPSSIDGPIYFNAGVPSKCVQLYTSGRINSTGSVNHDFRNYGEYHIGTYSSGSTIYWMMNLGKKVDEIKSNLLDASDPGFCFSTNWGDGYMSGTTGYANYTTSQVTDSWGYSVTTISEPTLQWQNTISHVVFNSQRGGSRMNKTRFQLDDAHCYQDPHSTERFQAVCVIDKGALGGYKWGGNSVQTISKTISIDNNALSSYIKSSGTTNISTIYDYSNIEKDVMFLNVVGSHNPVRLQGISNSVAKDKLVSAHIWRAGQGSGGKLYYDNGSMGHFEMGNDGSWKDHTWVGADPSNFGVWVNIHNGKTYYSSGSSNYVLNEDGETWTSVSFTGLTRIYGYYTWSDTINKVVHYEDNYVHYYLDGSEWKQFTYTEGSGVDLSKLVGDEIWLGPDNRYHFDAQMSSSSGNVEYHYILSSDGKTWSTHTWSGFAPKRGDYIWIDDNGVYHYDFDNDHYYLNSSGKWVSQTWTGWQSGMNQQKVYRDYNGNILISYYDTSTYKYKTVKLSGSIWSEMLMYDSPTYKYMGKDGQIKTASFCGKDLTISQNAVVGFIKGSDGNFYKIN